MVADKVACSAPRLATAFVITSSAGEYWISAVTESKRTSRDADGVGVGASVATGFITAAAGAGSLKGRGACTFDSVRCPTRFGAADKRPLSVPVKVPLPVSS